MNNDLFLAILALDSYSRGYGATLANLSDSAGVRIGNAIIKKNSSVLVDNDGNQTAESVGFYAVSYEWNGETIVSYRGTDGLNDVIKGWTTGAGWTDQAQANLAVEFYKAATGHDAFEVAIPSNITLTGHSLGGGLAGFVSMLSGVDAVMFDHMPFGRAAVDTYTTALEALAGDIASLSSDLTEMPGEIAELLEGKLSTSGLIAMLVDVVSIFQSGKDFAESVAEAEDTTQLRGPQYGNGLQRGYFVDGEVLEAVRSGAVQQVFVALTGLLTRWPLAAAVLEALGIDPISVQQMANDATYFEQFVPKTQLDTYGTTFSNNSVLDAVSKHSMSLAVTLLYAETENINVAWQKAAPYILPALTDESAAKQIGFKKDETGAGSEGAQMSTAIAYSAIAEGERPFGDQGIRAYFNDAVELGTAPSLVNVSDSFKGVADDIAVGPLQLRAQIFQ